MILGMSHITLVVKDLAATSMLFQQVSEAEPIYASGEKQFSLSKEMFLSIAGLWVCIMEGNALPSRTYNHIAFQIPEEEYDSYLDRIKKLDVDILPGRSRVSGEGRSIYFYDYDNHLFELHTGTLHERLDRYMQ